MVPFSGDAEETPEVRVRKDAGVSLPDFELLLRDQAQVHAQDPHQDHRKSHNNSKRFDCNDCGKVYMSWAALRKHRVVYCGKEPRRQCPMINCSYRTYMKGNLKTHIFSHRHVKSIFCPVCGKGYKNKNSLNHHKLNYCGKEPRFKCPIENCLYKTYTKITEVVYPCEKCGKIYKKLNSKNCHKSKYCGKEPKFHCPITSCAFRTYLKSNLKTHILTHTSHDQRYLYQLIDNLYQ
ncbi:PREDICTED: zinc finger protein 43-like [Nicrophorus vespilloides]|uniref:Zinc finger protein 43-like n=1 Tax=Nicrophorus vespilloides TaxID=110193 RepID=A0ABM1N9J0_NICVS|nr:PREDICTED: zinc finger protein 43-like [Nicrophorus vespilloides]